MRRDWHTTKPRIPLGVGGWERALATSFNTYADTRKNTEHLNSLDADVRALKERLRAKGTRRVVGTN